MDGSTQAATTNARKQAFVISLDARTNWANRPQFRARIIAAGYAGAVAAFNAPPNPDATKQASRMALIKAIGQNQDAVVNQAAWWIVSSFTSEDDLADDDKILTALTDINLFDTFAGMIT